MSKNLQDFCIKNNLPFAIEFEYPWYEGRYQYLNSLSIEEYDKETSLKEQEEFCEYQRKYHPDEVVYFQTHNPD